MRTIVLGNSLVKLETVDSTNNYAFQFLRQGEVEEGTVILAAHQTGGRGQGTNRWVSEKGLNLLFSIILKPDFLPASRQFYLSMAIAAGIQDYVSGLKLPARIKWPNDILIRGKKVAGVLIENTVLLQNLNTSIVGIGLNVNQKYFPPDLTEATSLTLETGTVYDLWRSLREMLQCIEIHVNNLYQGNLGNIKSDYLNRLWNLNTISYITDQTGTYEGKIVDIAETGELVVMKTNGECRIYGFREVVVSEKG